VSAKLCCHTITLHSPLVQCETTLLRPEKLVTAANDPNQEAECKRVSCAVVYRFGAFLPDVASFDSALLAVSSAEAALMDPQQRLLLETAAEVLLLASGSSAQPLPLQQQPWWGGVGAFIGIASSDYGSLVKAAAPAGMICCHTSGCWELDPVNNLGHVWCAVATSSAECHMLLCSRCCMQDRCNIKMPASSCLVMGSTKKTAHRCVLPSGAFHATANAISVAAGRLSYTFGLSGPAMSVDTACSASLVALHLAKDAVKSHGSSSSLVGGVHIQTTQTSTSYVWTAGMLSPSGRCQVLDAAADGYVRGEACHMLLLAPAAAAHAGRSSGSPVALILGSAVNQDGRSSSLTAPNGPAQQEVIQAALQDAGVAAGSVDQLSMHGTGTPLGRWPASRHLRP
jgi:acyl transferase domain-containing protein